MLLKISLSLEIFSSKSVFRCSFPFYNLFLVADFFYLTSHFAIMWQVADIWISMDTTSRHRPFIQSVKFGELQSNWQNTAINNATEYGGREQKPLLTLFASHFPYCSLAKDWGQSVREGLNGKKRFLSGINRMRGVGGRSTHAQIFWPFFKKCIFGQ